MARCARHARRELPPEDELPAAGPSPQAEAERAELREQIADEVERLPERYRAPFVLCELEQRSYEEAAKQLGSSPKTVSCWLSRARERLRQGLARRGVLPAATALPACSCDMALRTSFLSIAKSLAASPLGGSTSRVCFLASGFFRSGFSRCGFDAPA